MRLVARQEGTQVVHLVVCATDPASRVDGPAHRTAVQRARHNLHDTGVYARISASIVSTVAPAATC